MGWTQDPVATGDPAKSIGHEHTFGHDTADREVIERTLPGMADWVAWRLRAAGLKAATITLKLRDSSFATITRQTTLDVPADLTEPIYDAALVLLRRELHGQRIRLVGVTASNFRDREQLALFGAAEDPEAAPGGGGDGLDPAQVRRAVGDPRAARPGRACRRSSSATRTPRWRAGWGPGRADGPAAADASRAAGRWRRRGRRDRSAGCRGRGGRTDAATTGDPAETVTRDLSPPARIFAQALDIERLFGLASHKRTGVRIRSAPG